MTRDYPTWAQKNSYLADALVAMNQVSADVEADTTNVWKSIDLTITALHKLREAAGSEQMRRHDAMVARMEAARLARPTDPTPEVMAEVTPMTLTEARRLHQLTGRPAWTWPPLGRLAVTDTASGVSWSDWDPAGGPTAASIAEAQLLRQRASIVRRAVTR